MITLVIVIVNAVAEVIAVLVSAVRSLEFVPSTVHPVVLPPQVGEVE